MKKTPEQFNEPIEQGESPILTPSEIGALSPRVPRRVETLREAPKPIEARILDENGDPIIYIPEQVGEATPDTQFIKNGDRTKQPWVFKGRTKNGKVVLETEDGEGVTIDEREFQRNYERSRRIYVEKTKDGKREIKIDTEQVLRESVGFYTGHDLKDFLKELPKELRLSSQSEARLREAMRDGFDSAMLLPSTDLQKGGVNKLLTELADKQFPGLQDAEQYSQAHYIYEPDTTKNHDFDAYNDDAKKSKWTWLLDSRTPGGVVHASWDPGVRRVEVDWSSPGSSVSRLGARPAVVVEVEV